jgi:spore germination protein GerM
MVALLAGVLALCACGVPIESSPRQLSNDRLPNSLRPQATTVATTGTSPVESILVWLVQDQSLVSVSRQTSLPVNPKTICRSLGDPLVPAELDRSFRTAIPDPTMIVDATIVAGTALVVLDANFDQIPSSDQVLAIGQLVLSLTHLRGVGQVRFLVGDAEVAVPLPDGRSTRAAVSSDDYRSLAGT